MTLARGLPIVIRMSDGMMIIPQGQPKNAISGLPKLHGPQGSRPNSAVSALPRQGNDHVPTTNEILHKKASDLVGTTFFGTMLKQMRESPFKSDIMSGGRGEQAFGPMYDTIIAQRLARGAGQKLVRPIVKKFAKQAADVASKAKQRSLAKAYGLNPNATTPSANTSSAVAPSAGIAKGD